MCSPRSTLSCDPETCFYDLPAMDVDRRNQTGNGELDRQHCDFALNYFALYFQFLPFSEVSMET